MNYYHIIYADTQENIIRLETAHFHAYNLYAICIGFVVEIFFLGYFKMTFNKVFSKRILLMDFLHYQNISSLLSIHMLSFLKMG